MVQWSKTCTCNQFCLACSRNTSILSCYLFLFFFFFELENIYTRLQNVPRLTHDWVGLSSNKTSIKSARKKKLRLIYLFYLFTTRNQTLTCQRSWREHEQLDSYSIETLIFPHFEFAIQSIQGKLSPRVIENDIICLMVYKLIEVDYMNVSI